MRLSHDGILLCYMFAEPVAQEEQTFISKRVTRDHVLPGVECFSARSCEVSTSTLFIFRSLDDSNSIAAYSTAAVLATMSFLVLVCMEFFKKRSHKT